MSQDPNRPIGYNHMAYLVLTETGRFLPLERWAKGKPLVWPDPRSKKQKRAWDKTIRLAVRRLQRGGKFL